MLRQKHAVTAATARQIRRSALCRLLLSVRIWVSAAMGGERVLFKSGCDLVQNVHVPVCMCGTMSVSPGARVGVVQEIFWLCDAGVVDEVRNGNNVSSNSSLHLS